MASPSLRCCCWLLLLLWNMRSCWVRGFPLTEESGEALIYSTILDGYNVLERPVRNHTEAVHVHMKVEVQQIVDIDEKNQVMEMNVWLNFRWYDYRLTWYVYDHLLLTTLPIGHPALCSPSVDPSFGSTHMANILVFHDGKIEWIPPGITRSSCILNITWFPFDDQICYLKFGSWSYNKDKIILISEGTVIDNYMESGEWILLDYPTEVQDVVHHNDVGRSQYVFFKYHLRRRTLYFGFNLITPSLLVATLSILGFTMPVESGEKITLEITILLSICVFMNTVAQVTPITSESISLLSLFFFCHMVAVTVSIAFSVMVLNYHYRTPKTHSMSDWTRKILLNWLPWFLLMRRPKHPIHAPSFFTRELSIPESLRSDHSEAECRFHESASPTITDELELDQQQQQNGHFFANKPVAPRRILDPSTTSTTAVRRASCLQLEARIEESIHLLTADDPDSQGTKAILLSLEQIYHELKFMSECAAREEEIENEVIDWQFASAVVDRLCLVFFSVFIVCATMGVLLSSPHLVA